MMILCMLFLGVVSSLQILHFLHIFIQIESDFFDEFFKVCELSSLTQGAPMLLSQLVILALGGDSFGRQVPQGEPSKKVGDAGNWIDHLFFFKLLTMTYLHAEVPNGYSPPPIFCHVGAKMATTILICSTGFKIQEKN